MSACKFRSLIVLRPVVNRSKKPSMKCIDRSISTSRRLLLLILSFRRVFLSHPRVTNSLEMSFADSCDINVSPDKRTILLHSEGNLIRALKVRLPTTSDAKIIKSATSFGRWLWKTLFPRRGRHTTLMKPVVHHPHHSRESHLRHHKNPRSVSQLAGHP